jgi:GxxExxY protein
MNEFKNVDVTELILKAFYVVYNTLGHGFLEKVYVNALIIELTKLGLIVKHELSMQVYYDNKLVGEYVADLVVQDCVIIEVKAVKNLSNEHEAQLLNYLKATKIETGLLLNFGPKPEIKRRAFDNTRK